MLVRAAGRRSNEDPLLALWQRRRPLAQARRGSQRPARLARRALAGRRGRRRPRAINSAAAFPSAELPAAAPVPGRAPGCCPSVPGRAPGCCLPVHEPLPSHARTERPPAAFPCTNRAPACSEPLLRPRAHAERPPATFPCPCRAPARCLPVPVPRALSIRRSPASRAPLDALRWASGFSPTRLAARQCTLWTASRRVACASVGWCNGRSTLLCSVQCKNYRVTVTAASET